MIPQLRGVYNIPKVFEQKSGDKFKYVAEIRSMSEETGHSALLKAMIGVDNRTLLFSLPYIKENIPIGVVFKALGYVQDEEIRDLIGLHFDKTDKYIRLILRDAYFCEELNDGFDLYYKESYTDTLQDNELSENSETLTIWKEKWDKLTTKERCIWKNKLTTKNALKFLGQHAVHILKEHEQENYAKQVVENEIFPHLGVTSSIKEKAYFLGFIVNKLISTHVNLRKDDDRDDYINKRVESAGILCYDLLKQLFKNIVWLL